MPDKITNEELIQFAKNEVSAQQRTTITAFLQTNPEAKQFVRMYAAVASIADKDDTAVASANAIQRAKEIWQEKSQSKPQSKPSWLERIDVFVAELIFDSQVQRETIRGSSASREFEFKTYLFTVDVRFVRSQATEDEPWVLTGQIDFYDEKPADACISLRRSRDGEEVQQIHADDTGFFTLQGEREELEVLVIVNEQCTHLQGITFT